MRNSLGRFALVLPVLCGLSSLTLAQESLSDPTRPYAVSARVPIAAPSFKVNAIIVSADRRVAIVNGQRVVTGGSVNGARVIVIEKDHLILEKDGKRITSVLNGRVSRE